MSAKVVWVAMGLMGLLWVGGVGERWLLGTRELRLSVAPGGRGMVRREHRLEACATGRGKAARGVVPREHRLEAYLHSLRGWGQVVCLCVTVCA